MPPRIPAQGNFFPVDYTWQQRIWIYFLVKLVMRWTLLPKQMSSLYDEGVWEYKA